MTKGLPLSRSSQSSCSRRRARVSVISVMSLIGSPSLGEDEGRASGLADDFERRVGERDDEGFGTVTRVLHLLGRATPYARVEVDLIKAHEASGAGARGRQGDEPEAARCRRVDPIEGVHELGHQPEVEGRVAGVGATRGVADSLEEISRGRVQEVDAAMRHLDHGEGEEGPQRGLRFPGGSGSQGPQDRGDVERSDPLDRAGMEGRADHAQPAFARMVVLGVLERLGDLREVPVDRAAEGDDAGLHVGPQAGFADAARVFAFVDCTKGVPSLPAGRSEADERICAEADALALAAATKTQNPRAPESARLVLRGRRSDHQDQTADKVVGMLAVTGVGDEFVGKRSHVRLTWWAVWWPL